MSWKSGKVTLDDGTVYPAEFLLNENGQVYNMKVYKDEDTVEEIDAQNFSNKLGKDEKDVYPYTYELDE
ncbi:MAG: hypothetical protein K9L17_12555 [Clostridiales bacterium]|nr:hypothetical protein [Clostridiales bacterium]MCF8023513.1 hypothetical protein [Clostridiales bacterium]